MLNRPITATILCLAIIIFGWISLSNLSVDLLPNLDTPTLLVRTQWLGASPQEIEDRLNEPMEGILSGIPGLKDIKSISKQSLSLISLEFEWGQNMDLAFLNTREKLDQIRYFLPEDSERPLLLHSNPADEPIAILSVGYTQKSEGKPDLKDNNIMGNEINHALREHGMSSTPLGLALKNPTNQPPQNTFEDLIRLERWVDNILTRRLEQIDGISQAVVVGAVIPEVRIKYDPIQLNRYGLTIDDIERTIKQSNDFISTGELRDGWYRYSLKIEGQFKSIEEIQSLPIKTVRLKILYLRDVASVSFGEKDITSFSLLGSKNILTVLIKKNTGENTVEVFKKILPLVKSFEVQYPEIDIKILKENASFIENNIENVFQSLILGSLLAFIILFVYLNDPRLPLAIGLSIPISIFVTFIFMYISEVQLNIISLCGLTLGVGLLVDNSIVVLENINRHLEKKDLLSASVRNGTREVMMAITASSLTTISVFIPLIFIGGFEGLLFRDLALTLSFSLIASLVVALTILPVTALKILEKTNRKEIQVNKIVGLIDKIREKYERSLDWSLDNSKFIVLFIVLIFISGMIVIVFIPKRLLPDSNENYIVCRITLPSNTPLSTTRMVAEYITNDIMNKTMKSGANNTNTSFTSPLIIGGYADESNLINIKNEGLNIFTIYIQVQSLSHADTVRKRMNELAENHIDWRFQYLKNNTFLSSFLEQDESAVSFILIERDRERAKELSKYLSGSLQKIDSSYRIKLSYSQDMFVYQIILKKDKLFSMNLAEIDVHRYLSSLQKGNFITEWKRADEEIDIRLYANSFEHLDIEQIKIPTNGRSISLKDLADIKLVSVPEQLERENQTPVLRFNSSITLYDWWWKKAAIIEATDHFSQKTGIQTYISGVGEQIDKLMNKMIILLLMSVLLIYIILAIQYENLKYPMVILLSIPIAWIGSLLLMELCGTSLNMISILGILVLTGIAVNDAILKIDFLNTYYHESNDLVKAIQEAGKHRFRPIVMTTLTTILGMLPMLFPFGVGYELRQSLSIAIIGGMVTSTLFTFYVIPLIFKILNK